MIVILNLSFTLIGIIHFATITQICWSKNSVQQRRISDRVESFLNIISVLCNHQSQVHLTTDKKKIPLRLLSIWKLKSFVPIHNTQVWYFPYLLVSFLPKTLKPYASCPDFSYNVFFFVLSLIYFEYVICSVTVWWLMHIHMNLVCWRWSVENYRFVTLVFNFLFPLLQSSSQCINPIMYWILTFDVRIHAIPLAVWSI